MEDITDKKLIKYISYKRYKRNLFRLKKENRSIKDRKIRDIRNHFEHEEKEDYCKPVRVGSFYNNNYIEYERNRDRNKTLSLKEYLDDTKPYLKDVIINLKRSDTWKI